MDGLIDPEAFPCKSVDLNPDGIAAGADLVAAVGVRVAGAVEQVGSAWLGLRAPGVFETPDGDAVYGLMDPAVADAAMVSGVTGRVATVLHAYAGELAGIKPVLRDLEVRAEAFRLRALAGYQVTMAEASGFFDIDKPSWSMELTTIPWVQHGPAVAENQSLLAEYNRILEKVSAAAAGCANAIRAESGVQCVSGVEPVTAAEFASASRDAAWGRPVEERRNCSESIGHGLWNFASGTVTGTASLVGRDSETGRWDFAVAQRSWLGVGDFLFSTVVVLLPTGSLYFAPGPVGDFVRERNNVFYTSWGSLIGWDHQEALAGGDGWRKWRADGVATATESLANVATFFIPSGVGAGARAALTGTRAGMFVVRTAGRVGDVVITAAPHLTSKVLRVADFSSAAFGKGWQTVNDLLKPSMDIKAASGMASTGVRRTLLERLTVTEKFALDPKLDLDRGPRARVGSAVKDPQVGSGSGVQHAPGVLTRQDRVRIHQELASELRGDPQHDPLHPHYDSLSHDGRGNIGTVDPDVLSESGLTHGGRLIDPDVIPEPLRRFVESDPPVIVVRDGVLYLADNIEVTFNRNVSHHDLGEFTRQVDLQEHAMRQLNLSEWDQNVRNYHTQGGRLETQRGYRKAWIEARIEALEADGYPTGSARRMAKAEIKGQVGLHGPDQVAGGNPKQLTGFGDGRINSAIGSQWGKGLGQQLQRQLQKAIGDSGLPAELLGDIRLNVSLKVNDAAGGALKVPVGQGVIRTAPTATR